MAKVVVSGWRSGLLKISMTHIIKDYTELGLRESKDCTDRVLDGETVVLTAADEEQAEQLAARLQLIGAVAKAA